MHRRATELVYHVLATGPTQSEQTNRDEQGEPQPDSVHTICLFEQLRYLRLNFLGSLRIGQYDGNTVGLVATGAVEE